MNDLNKMDFAEEQKKMLDFKLFIYLCIIVLKLKNLFIEKSSNLIKLIEYYCYISDYRNVLITYEKLLNHTEFNKIKEYNILDLICISYYNLNEYNKDIEIAQKILSDKNDFNNFQTYSIYSLLCYSIHKTGDSQKANAMLKNIMSNSNLSRKIKFLVYILIAYINIDNKKLIEASENINIAMDYIAEEYIPFLFSILSLLYIEKNNHYIAKKFFKIKLNLNKKISHKKILKIANETKKIAYALNEKYLYKLAIRLYKKLLKKRSRLSVDFEEILYSLSMLYYKIEKYCNSKRYIRFLLKHSKKLDKMQLNNLLACNYYKLGLYEQAIELFEMLLKDQRICLGRIYYNLAYCYFDFGQYMQAEQAIKKAINENDLEEKDIKNLKELQISIDKI